MENNGEFKLWSKDFTLICIANLLYFGRFYFLLATLPVYVQLLRGTEAQIGLVMGFFTLASVVLRPYIGKMADTYGRKLFMAIGAGSFVLFPYLYFVAADISQLYLVRVLHGLGHAAFMAASSAYVADLAPPQRRGEVIGIYATSNIFSMALFPALGLGIIGKYSFSVLFLASAVTAAVSFFATIFLSKAFRGRPEGKVEVSTMEIGRKPWVLIPSLTLFAAATSYGAVVTFLPVYAPTRGLEQFGVFFTVYAGATILSRVIAGRLSDRIGRARVVIPFMAILVLAVFLFGFLSSLWLLWMIAVLFGLGFGAFMPTLNALVVDKTPPAERGRALGFFTAFMDVGITAGSMGLGLVSNRWGFPVMFWTAAVVVALGLVYFILSVRVQESRLAQGRR